MSDETPHGEGSDLFKVQGIQSIPSIAAVPETKEEKQQRRMARLLWLVTGIVVTVVAVSAGWFVFTAMRLQSAVEDAENDGRRPAIEHALGLIGTGDDPEDVAHRARFEAILALAGDGELEPVLEAIQSGNGESSGTSNRLIAATYVAIAMGDAETATANASQLSPSGALAAEAAVARAMAALSVANPEQALEQIEVAVSERPQAPRFRALASEVQLRLGNGTAALEQLEGADAAHTAVQVTRARALMALDRDADEALELCESVMAAPDATPREKAWAQVTKAWVLVRQGKHAEAVTALAGLDESIPPGDQAFALALGEAALSLGQREMAQAALETAATGGADPAREAALRAELLLTSGDADAAAGALSDSMTSPRVSLVRGRILAAQGNLAGAKTHFEAAAEDPSLKLRALSLLGENATRLGQPAQALLSLAALIEDAEATHPAVAAALANAHRALDDGGAALSALAPALEAHPNSALLLTARGRVHLSASEWSDALSDLTAAVEADPNDADRQADRGIAAEKSGNAAAAREAYDAALALFSKQENAVLGRWRLDVAESQPDGAAAMLETVDEMELEGLPIEILRAETLVLNARGAEGVRTVRRAGNDRPLLLAAGKLYFQSEQYDAAASAFGRANTGEEIDPELSLLRALCLSRLRRTPPAQRILDDLRDAELEPRVEAIRRQVQARIIWVSNARGRAVERAREAIALDANMADAHMLLAEYAVSRNEDPLEHYRAAAASTPSFPEAWGYLAQTGTLPAAERCDFARRYLAASPRGENATDLRERIRRCPD